MATFDVHLPSNTPEPGNQANSYKIRLPQKIVFNSQWLVGLSVINYPHTWHNVDKSEDTTITLQWTNMRIERIKIPPGRYNTPDQLCAILNLSLEKHGKENKNSVGTGKAGDWSHVFANVQEHLKFAYNQDLKRIEVEVNNRYIRKVQLPQQIAYIAGFTNGAFTQKNTIGDCAPNFIANTGLIFVYAPGLIEPATIGNSTAPLLRVVNVKNEKSGELVEEAYQNIQYHRILSKEISEIEIELRDSTGKLIRFEHGCVLITINFKKAPLI